jgi:hypothetical protein
MRPIVILSVSLALAACNHNSNRAEVSPASFAGPVPAAPAPAPEVAPRTPEGLALLLMDYDRKQSSGADAASLLQARLAIDQMAAQRDAHVSRLFWYTDLDEAKAAARKGGRPILSLRLLGRLDEELSCANSRLFRIVLYGNAGVSAFLRDNYVLYWSSERPVPRMTLDYGDGRVIERTITGNSVHYVLDAKGRIVDALPGLYGPAAFERGLRESLELARKSGELSDEESAKAVANYHARETWLLTASWRKQLLRGYGKDYSDFIDKATLPDPAKVRWSTPFDSSVPASAVNMLTESKADLEAPSLALLQPEILVSEDSGDWGKIADKQPKEHLDAQSKALLRDKHPRDWGSPGANELDAAQLEKRLSQFETRLTEEELRNEFAFHGAVHVRLSRPSRVDLAKTNEYVYTRLFMTPKSDTWLGLTTAAVTGIDDDGLVARTQ